MQTRYKELKTLDNQLKAISLNLFDGLSREERMLVELQSIRSRIGFYLDILKQDELTEVIDRMFDMLEDLDRGELITMQCNFHNWIRRPEQKQHIVELTAIDNLLNQLNFN